MSIAGIVDCPIHLNNRTGGVRSQITYRVQSRTTKGLGCGCRRGALYTVRLLLGSDLDLVLRIGSQTRNGLGGRFAVGCGILSPGRTVVDAVFPDITVHIGTSVDVHGMSRNIGNSQRHDRCHNVSRCRSGSTLDLVGLLSRSNLDGVNLGSKTSESLACTGSFGSGILSPSGATINAVLPDVTGNGCSALDGEASGRVNRDRTGNRGSGTINDRQRDVLGTLNLPAVCTFRINLVTREVEADRCGTGTIGVTLKRTGLPRSTIVTTSGIDVGIGVLAGANIVSTQNVIELDDLLIAHLDIAVTITATEVVGVTIPVTRFDLNLGDCEDVGVGNDIVSFRPEELSGHILSTRNFKRAG